jgi:hypothetical protein
LPGGAGTLEGSPLFGSEALLDGGEGFRAESEFHDDGDGAASVGGSGERKLNFDGDGGIGRIVDMAEQSFGEDGDFAIHLFLCADDFPVDSGNTGGDAAVNFTIEECNDLGSALRPPDLRSGDLFPIGKKQRIGKVGNWGDFGFVKVGGMGRFGIAVGAVAESGDVEKVKGTLMILVGGEMDGGRGRLRRGGERGEGKKQAKQRMSRESAHGG